MKSRGIMKLAKTTLAVVFAACGELPLAADDFLLETVNGVQWTYVVKDGKATVGFTEEVADEWGGEYTRDHPAVPVDTSGAVTIPAKLGGYPVVGISDGAFEECEKITSITIPNGVKTIGAAFEWCSNLTKITIPASVTSIDDGAFAWCTKLMAIALDSNNKSFVYTDGMLLSANKKRILAVSRAATSISIPNGVTVLPYGFLAGCTKLTTLTIPKSAVDTVDGWLDALGYDSCTSLTTIKVDPNHPVLKVVNGILVNKEDTSYIEYIPAGLTSVTIPNGVTALEAWDFENNHAKLESVTVPLTVTRIANDVFADFGHSVKLIVSRYANPEWTTGYFSGAVTVVRGLPGEPTFRYAPRYSYNWGDAEDGESELDYGDGIVITGSSGIKGAIAIPSQIDGQTVTGIGRKALCKNKSITSLDIPATVNRIGYAAFEHDTAIKSVSIAGGASVDMGKFVFAGCNGLAKNGFVVVNGVLYHYTGKGGTVTIPSTVRVIDDEVFRKNMTITAVNIPSSVRVIRDEAFEHCAKLTRVSIAEGPEILGDKVFYGCKALVRFNIPASADTEICWGQWRAVAWQCPKLKSITIPDNEDWSWLRNDLPAGLKVNSMVTATFNPTGGVMDGPVDESGVAHVDVAYLDSLGSFLPEGLFIPARKGHTFLGWFTAKSKGSKISVNTTVSRAVTYYAQWRPAKYKITVKAGNGGKVSGSGTYNCGSTATIKATPNKGYVFVRWEDAEFDVAHDAGYEVLWTQYEKQYRQTPLSLKVPAGNLTLRAVFAKASADSAAPVVSIGWDGPWNLEADEDATIPVMVMGSLSGSVVKGGKLPAGLSLAMGEDDAHYVLKVSDRKRLRPGTSIVTITATNRAGKKGSATITVIGRNATTAIDRGFISGLDTSTTEGYKFKGGIAQSWTLSDLGASLARGCMLTKVTGLPSGWKFANGKVSGIAAPGTYTIFFTVTKGKTSSQASATFTIEPLPGWTVGTYYGTIMLRDQKSAFGELILSRVAITVSPAGKVSGSFYDPMIATKCTFSGVGLVPGMDGGDGVPVQYEAKVSGTMGKKAVAFKIGLARNRSAEFSTQVGTKTYYTFNCYQSYGTKSYGADDEGIASLDGKTLYDGDNTTFVFGKGGTVKVFGTFVHPVSKKKYTSTASAQIVRDDDTGRTYIPVYVQYKDGSSDSFCYEIVFTWEDDGVSYALGGCMP